MYCDKHGHYDGKIETLDIGGLKITKHTSCPYCKQEAKNDDAKQKIAKLQKLKQQALIPKRYKDANFDNFIEHTQNTKNIKNLCQHYVDNWQDVGANGGGFIFFGGYGNGKTRLGCTIINELISKYSINAVYASLYDVLNAVKNGWRDADEGKKTKHYYNVDLLVIDEVGVNFGSDADKIILFNLINKRYESMLPTILISNLSADNLSNYLSRRVIDRLIEGGGSVLQFNDASLRCKK